MFFTYSFEQVRVLRAQPGLQQPGAAGAEPVPRATRCCSARAASARSARSTPSFVLQHRRQPDLPDHAGARSPRSFDWPAPAATPTSSSRRFEAVQLLALTRRARRSASAARSSTSGPTAAPTCCRSTRRCSSAANTASAASTSGRSARAIHAPALVLGGNKSLLFNAEYIDLRLPGRCGWCCSSTPARCATRGQSFALDEDDRRGDCRRRRRPLIDPLRHRHPDRPERAGPTTTEVIGQRACLQDLDRRRDPLLHAGAERAVPADLRHAIRRAPGVSPTTCSRRKQFQFRFAVGSTF